MARSFTEGLRPSGCAMKINSGSGRQPTSISTSSPSLTDGPTMKAGSSAMPSPAIAASRETSPLLMPSTSLPPDDQGTLRPLETPVGDTAIGVENSPVVFEVGWRGRHAVPRQIVRRGDEKPAAAGKRPRDKTGIGNQPVADDRIISIGSSIDAAVIEFERQFDLWMRGQKGIERRAEMHAAEGDGGGNPQRPGQRAAPFGKIGRGFTHLAHDPRRPLQEYGAVLRQRQLARRAVQQRSTQRLLHLRQPLADHGFR